MNESMREVFARHRWRLLLAVVFLLTTMLAGVGLLGLSGGFLTGAALAGAAGMGATFNFFSPSAGIRGLTMARIVSRYFEKLVGHDVTLRIARDLRVWFFRRALPLAPARLGGSRTGELLARLVSDISEVDGVMVRAAGPLLALLGIVLASVVAAALIYWPAALLLVAIAGAIGIGVPVLAVRHGEHGEMERAQTRASLRTLAYEGLEGVADLTALQAQGDWIARVDAAALQVAARDRRRRRRLIAGNVLHSACAGVGLLAMLWLALHAFEGGQVSGPLAAALLFLTVALLEVAAGSSLAWQSLQSARVAGQRLRQIVDQAPAVEDPAQPRALPDTPAEVSFEQVVFHWPGESRQLLDGVELRLRPGERVAIRGDSGCGKTTLSALLLRLWDPRQGAVRYGGVDLRDVAQEAWHRKVAWLPQGAPVFAGSISENLRLGDPQADDAAMWSVLEQVRLSAWAQQQGGLSAWVGENGATMSAGQARRLALARALLRDTPLMVLDEPTEGLDVDTAHALLLDLAAALGSRSLLMITHDPLPDGVVHREYRLQHGQLQPLTNAEVPAR
ncbi:ABC transporter ATP-binding protein [Stenotrophomonas pictorum JCM 9942]|uniref:ABC transporter ATP-binding protein n=1 Tax=Stenotrophomonas pictorum JCM 9942 TaxID=1236960 RepID=A0A0R0AMG5_9GAMM|nr:thiol reductant ABC exporter subunit CydC [Stenotrophomonas pictorum]KRG42718.1 ABC transporter ATP-binding protein [Stenotrophomonas pictorum JCM 9942]